MQLCTSETKRVETRTSRLSVNTKVGENQQVLEPFERLRNSTFCFDFSVRFFSSLPISSLIFISLSCFHLWHWRCLCFSSLSFHPWYPGAALSRSFGLSVNQSESNLWFYFLTFLLVLDTVCNSSLTPIFCCCSCCCCCCCCCCCRSNAFNESHWRVLVVSDRCSRHDCAEILKVSKQNIGTHRRQTWSEIKTRIWIQRSSQKSFLFFSGSPKVQSNDVLGVLGVAWRRIFGQSPEFESRLHRLGQRLGGGSRPLPRTRNR